MSETSEQTASSEIDRQAYDFAKDLVYLAGGLARDSLATGNYTSQWKEDNTPVTSIDIEVNKLVIDQLHQHFPGDRVYGEEESADAEGEHSGNTWILDPIDGTQALEQEDIDAITICLARLDSDGNPMFGLVYNPQKDRLFAAVRGEAATMNGEPIHVSNKTKLMGSYIYLGSKIHGEGLATNGVVYDHIEDAGGKVENRRALAYSCMQVARGLAEGAYIGVTKPFEAASVKLIVEGAGGKVTDLYGGDAGRLDGKIRGLVVSNGQDSIHDKLIEAVVLPTDDPEA